jgi:preprotein translocase subunit SecF
MEFFRIQRDIPFMRHALVFNVISVITFLLAVVSLSTKGLHFGVDFTGGTVMEVSYDKPADLDRIRETVTGLGLSDVWVQNFGSAREVLLRLPLKEDVAGAKLSERVLQALRAADSSVELRRVEFVGPQVGRELVENGALALLFVCLGIVLYLWMRFEWKFGLAAIIANLHDVVIILGFFSFFQWEFSLPVLAAVLAVLGYSVNESVVVFDRIRENFRKMRRAPVPQIIDNAITRTIRVTRS